MQFSNKLYCAETRIGAALIASWFVTICVHLYVDESFLEHVKHVLGIHNAYMGWALSPQPILFLSDPGLRNSRNSARSLSTSLRFEHL